MQRNSGKKQKGKDQSSLYENQRYQENISCKVGHNKGMKLYAPRLHFHFSLSCIGEGNGNPLQCSCLENPRDGGACWAAVYGVAQSRIRLKQLSSSSSVLQFTKHVHTVSAQMKQVLPLFCVEEAQSSYMICKVVYSC